MDKHLFIQIVLLLLCMVYAGWWTISYKRDRIEEHTRSEQQLTRKYDSLQLELKAEQRNRTLLRDSIRTLQSGQDSLTQQISLKDKELKSIKGRYKHHTSSELEVEMERRAK